MYLKVLEVYGHLIFPYLDKYTDLVALSQTSSEVSETVLASDFWSEDSLDVCMVTYCSVFKH